MTRTITILTAAVLVLSGPAVFAQASAQAGGQASGSASAQASQSGAQASGGAAGSASASGAQGGQQGSQGSLATGTALNAQLSQPIDSKKCKAGDPVTARTTESAKSEGKTVLPKGTKLVGHVTRASARSKGDADSALGVQFDRAILKDGREIPLQASIQALAAAQTVAAVGGDDLQGAGGAAGGAGGFGTTNVGSLPPAAANVARVPGWAVWPAVVTESAAVVPEASLNFQYPTKPSSLPTRVFFMVLIS